MSEYPISIEQAQRRKRHFGRVEPTRRTVNDRTILDLASAFLLANEAREAAEAKVAEVDRVLRRGGTWPQIVDGIQSALIGPDAPSCTRDGDCAKHPSATMPHDRSGR